MLGHTANGASEIPADDKSLIDVPLAILKAELERRQQHGGTPACGSGSKRGSYNLSAHVLALVLILTLSTLACGFPLIVRKFPRLPVPHRFLFLSRHFGTGVLIATAFVHLFPTAYVSLTDPCLPSFWNTGYPAMAGLIAMTSALIVVGIEMFFAIRGAGHVHGSDYDSFTADEGQHIHGSNGSALSGHNRSASVRRFRQGSIGDLRPPALMLDNLPSESENLIAGRSPSIVAPSPLTPVPSKAADDEDQGNDHSRDSSLDNLGTIDDDPDSASSNLLHHSKARTRRDSHRRRDADSPARSQSHSAAPRDPSDPTNKKLLLQCLLLEAGILFHSVFIGLAVSVSVGPPFVVLLIAISFHQTFEGLALGSRIAAVVFPPRSIRPWLMALAYGTTTPIGQAIGLAIHGLYDPESQMGLLMVGVMNAISSGLLLFAGMVELLAEDFLSEQSYKTLKGKRRLEACGAVVAGAGLMALVGAWA